MSKAALDAKRRDSFLLEPERLTLVTDKNHPLYDPRVEEPPSESMIANIAMHGVLEPIIVRKNGDAIEVVAGRGRTKATLEANRRLIAEGKPPLLIPAIVRGGSDADLFGVLVSENEIRREDSMIHKGEKARKLLNMGYTVQQIAVTFGATRQAVDQWLAVDELPTPIKDAVESGEVSATAALQMSGHSREEQIRRYEDIKQRGEKPTVRAMKSAAESPDNIPAPKMRTRRDVEKHISRIMPIENNKPDEFHKGYIAALRWVLGIDDGE